MKHDFYMTLPSNSSMKFYPNNTTTHFITQLPQEIRLSGEWVVALTEIIYPQTFLHIPEKTSDLKIVYSHRVSENAWGFKYYELIPGFYNNVKEITDIISNMPEIKTHFQLYQVPGGYTCIERICDENCELGDVWHSLSFDPPIAKILGFEAHKKHGPIKTQHEKIFSKRIGSIINSLPKIMFVYSDICETSITGDVQTQLLSTVPINYKKFEFGDLKMYSATNKRFTPLQKLSFNTIEIDIRDDLGNPIPFEYGTLTVTLHFRRID